MRSGPPSRIACNPEEDEERASLEARRTKQKRDGGWREEVTERGGVGFGKGDRVADQRGCTPGCPRAAPATGLASPPPLLRPTPSSPPPGPSPSLHSPSVNHKTNVPLTHTITHDSTESPRHTAPCARPTTRHDPPPTPRVLSCLHSHSPRRRQGTQASKEGSTHSGRGTRNQRGGWGGGRRVSSTAAPHSRVAAGHVIFGRADVLTPPISALHRPRLAARPTP